VRARPPYVVSAGICAGNRSRHAHCVQALQPDARASLRGKWIGGASALTTPSEGAVVLSREPRRCGNAIATPPSASLALAFTLQTAVVALLLRQMRRLRRAKESLKESEERMAFAASSVKCGHVA
jgi:hypothetical protein